MQGWNIALFEWMAGGHAPQAHWMWVATMLAEGASWACVAIMGWVAWKRPSQRAWILGTLAAAGVAAIVAHQLADAFAMPRPFMLRLSPAHIEHGARGGLPSAHASVMFSAAFIFLLRPALRRAGFAILAIAALTGWARIYVGVHFPLDIVAGMLVGIAIAAGFVVVRQLGARAVRRLLPSGEPARADAPAPVDPVVPPKGPRSALGTSRTTIVLARR